MSTTTPMTSGDICVVHASCDGTEDDCRDSSGCKPSTGRGVADDVSSWARTPKTRTITLTDRPPVKIREDEWPEIASAKLRPGSMRNGTPVPDYETDCYTLRVREHADGRIIVYGVVDASTAWTGTEDWRGGELLTPRGTLRNDAAGASWYEDVDRIRVRVPSQEIAESIARVGERMPERVIRECIADLPAEEI